MTAPADRMRPLGRTLLMLLALVLPALVGYELYFQLRTPVVDMEVDLQTGLVGDVPPRSLGNYAGFYPGDVIRSIEGQPFSIWPELAPGLYMVEVERSGQLLTMELPIVALARVNGLYLASAILVALTFWAVGLLLLLRCGGRSDVHLLYLLGQAFGVAALFHLAHPPPRPIPTWGLMAGNAALYLAAPLLLHYSLTFPVRLGSPRQRRLTLGAIYSLALLALLSWPGQTPFKRWGAVYVLVQIVLAFAVLVYVYLRRATPDGRRRLRLVVLGTVAAAAPTLLLYILPFMAGSALYLPEWLTGLFLILAPLSYLYATARHNLFGIDRLLNRSLVYALLALGILLVYLGPFLLLYRLAPGDPLAQVLVGAGLTLLVGLAFDTTRAHVQRLVDRLFYGGWYDYAGVVETVSAALAHSLDRGQVSDILTRQVPALMQLQPGQLWIGAPEETPPETEPGSALSFPFAFAGRGQAMWTVMPRQDGDELTTADRRILQTLADQAEVALSNVLLIEALRQQLDEIRASRETLAQAQQRLLRSREEERMRLARDLHDGPIQMLVGLNLQLGLLTAESSPIQAELEAMRAEVKALLGELRQLCAQLRPPLLDALGLGAALRALAADWSAQHGIETAVTVPADETLGHVPEEIAVNLFRVAQEALTNVARHAHARSVALSLAVEEDSLCLTVADDGCGFEVPADLTRLAENGHYGLAGMQERAALIGAQLEVTSTPGEGTTILTRVTMAP